MAPTEGNADKREPEDTSPTLIAECPRWRAVLSMGSLKGIPEADARWIAKKHGGKVEKSWVRLYSDGIEVLGPWAVAP